MGAATTLAGMLLGGALTKGVFAPFVLTGEGDLGELVGRFGLLCKVAVAGLGVLGTVGTTAFGVVVAGAVGCLGVAFTTLGVTVVTGDGEVGFCAVACGVDGAVACFGLDGVFGTEGVVFGEASLVCDG